MVQQLRGVLRVRTWGGLVLSLLLGASYAAMPLFALLPQLWGFAAVSAISYGADAWLHRIEPSFIRRLAAFGMDRTLRFLARDALLLVLAERMDAPEPVLVAGLIVLGGQFGVLVFYGALHRVIRRMRTLPMAVRNLDMGGAGIPEAPAALLYRRYLRRLLHLDLPMHAGLLAGLATSHWLVTKAGYALSLALPALALLALAGQLRKARRMPGREEFIAEVNRQLAAYRPEVALYFSFAAVSRDFMYQVNMWIETLEQLDRRPVIILRERASFRYLSRTRLPVLCVPKADDVAELDMPDLKVVLYPGNAGKNVHMLRVAEAKHVFIGHGDSDKLASSNRVSKVYDEIWVAGRAGRDRYQRIRHAIDDAAIVEVGRPQLAPIRVHAHHVPGPLATVLYAPTWEGWSDDDCHTSLIPMGVDLVSALLGEGVRVLYKPHPLTGKRSPAAAQADRTVREMLAADNQRRQAGGTVGAAAGDLESRLREIRARIDELTGRESADDDAEQTRDARLPQDPGSDEWQALHAEWHRLYWNQIGPLRHDVITGQLPTLYECFNQADLLISDVSSVVADFVASLKPYVLTNANDLPDEEFRAAYTTAGGAYLLDRACTRLPDILRSVRDPAHDPMAPDRHSVKEYLLGPDQPTSMERFNTAVNALAETAVLHQQEHALDGVPSVPAPTPQPN
ncbi:hypothetical protein OG426_09540 [Streptomyces canus]|uniref:hypothetical protein n=1 Tax=Streptomyces canus TaxID=58343 RepID=UPI002256E941|nr:hypothetical protein [Streptomyces canus]MCX4862218.1 hypothetical protein [Streptomyces canus]WSW32688.1 hypothetical protein OG426_09540 [Streptomyces canus]